MYFSFENQRYLHPVQAFLQTYRHYKRQEIP